MFILPAHPECSLYKQHDRKHHDLLGKTKIAKWTNKSSISFKGLSPIVAGFPKTRDFVCCAWGTLTTHARTHALTGK